MPNCPAELDPISLDSDLWVRTFRLADGACGILVVVDVSQRRFLMVLTECQALIEAGRLETEGVIQVCDIEAEPFPMYLDPVNAGLVSRWLRRCADHVGSMASIPVDLGPSLLGVVQ